MNDKFAGTPNIQAKAFGALGSQNLSGELNSIKRQLAAMADKVDQVLEKAEENRIEPTVSNDVAEFLDVALRAELVRRSLMDGVGRSTDPSWSVLLVLIQAYLKGEPLTLRDLPMSADDGHFWLKTLKLRGLAREIHHSRGIPATTYTVTEEAYRLFLASFVRDNFDGRLSARV
ncbi:hypothetical protein E5222_05080 [Alteraurantiacibacter aquimixticola]|uniref:Uncharacterized protein n=2 Tax=Alteraurantiacibacter aquimixticola TaxID=2489173 RepID=A0A4T3F9W9_9SPHN|nr:hypothetical protein E5222_05080 [Alteraurantiacibacter aquimixticola]